VHWPSIRADRLSSHHGEFCKLFCSNTGRDVDFFSEQAAQCPEQLLNMIDMCTVFSSGNGTDCAVFRALFSVVPDKNIQVSFQKTLDSVKKCAVGARELRNKLAHHLLTLNHPDFDSLVDLARKLLTGLCSVFACIVDRRSYQHCFDIADQALIEIEGFLEHEKVRRSFDAFLPCLMYEIEGQLIPSAFGCANVRQFSALMLRLGNQIGQSGGHGTVYKVKYGNQLLGVKVFGQSDSEAWRRELASLTFLPHSNIVRVFYIIYESIDDQRSALRPSGYAMELMAHSAGDDIEFTLHQLLSLFEQIATALAFCHDHDVVHFDVKPENILLDDACATAKLCDFGHAHKLRNIAEKAAASAVSGMQRGTLDYMAPEVYRGQVEGDDSKLCDIYSFGKTMWKLLHPSANITPLSSCLVSASVPSALKELVELCTSQQPAERPQSMSNVLLVLTDVRSNYQKDETLAAERHANPFPSGSFLAGCYRRFGGQRFDIKYCTDLKQHLKYMWCQWRLWAFQLVALIVLLGSAKEVRDDGLYMPWYESCPGLNASQMPIQYSMAAESGQNMSILTRDGITGIVLEPRIVTQQLFDTRRLFLSPGMYRRDIVVLLWISNRLAAVFRQNENSMYDCHGNMAYKTCYDCDKQLKIYSSDGDYIWLSSKPSTTESGSDSADGAVQVFGQPLNAPVAVVSTNYTFTILESSHAASDPILLTTIFARAYFEDNYRNTWETIHDLCLVLMYCLVLLLLAASAIKLIQAGHAGLMHYFFKLLFFCARHFDEYRNRSTKQGYVGFV
jgi:hypothetical protein